MRVRAKTQDVRYGTRVGTADRVTKMHTLILVQNDEKLQKAFKEDKFKGSSDFIDVKRFTVFDETSPEAQSFPGRRMISGAARANSRQRLATKLDMGEWLFIGL